MLPRRPRSIRSPQRNQVYVISLRFSCDCDRCKQKATDHNNPMKLSANILPTKRGHNSAIIARYRIGFLRIYSDRGRVPTTRHTYVDSNNKHTQSHTRTHTCAIGSLYFNHTGTLAERTAEPGQPVGRPIEMPAWVFEK